jgi:hypothetical protein
VVSGVVVVPGSVVVLGAEDALGSGLAADTTATAPPTSSRAERPAVRTARFRPDAFGCGATGSGGGSGAGDSGVSGAGKPGWSFQSTVISFDRIRWLGVGRLDQAMGTSGPVGSGVVCRAAGPCADLEPIVAARSESGVSAPPTRRARNRYVRTLTAE